MSERLRESLSALMDDEADDLELGRILRAMDSGEADLGATWSRYQLVSAVLKGSPSSVGLQPLALDLDAADAGPMDEASADGGADVGLEGLLAGASGGKTAERGRTRRALGSFAVAASITAVAVVGWQWQSAVEGGLDGGSEWRAAQMAGGASMPAPATAPVVSVLPSLRAAEHSGLLQASEPGRGGRELARMQPSPLSPFTPRSLAAVPSPDAVEADMRQQVEAYIIRHAEHNALYSRSGMMPFARMAAFDGSQ